MAKKSNLGVSSPLLYLVLGILLVVFKSQMLAWAMTIAGIFFIVMGIVDLGKKRTLSGAVNLVIGLAVLVLGWTFVEIVLFVLGVLIAIKGVTDLIRVLNHKKSKKGVLKLLFPCLTIALGVALALGNGFDMVIMGIGILLIIDGAIGLIGNR